MSKLSILILLCLTFCECKSQNDVSIKMTSLVKFVESSNFSGFVKYIHSLAYVVMDSSKDKNGSLIYITQKRDNGNILGCTVRPGNKLNHLTFSTYDKSVYEILKKQTVDMGFKPGSTGTGGFPEVVESQDFEKGNLLVSISAIKKRGNKMEYEFIILKL